MAVAVRRCSIPLWFSQRWYFNVPHENIIYTIKQRWQEMRNMKMQPTRGVKCSLEMNKS